ncbi:LysR family transcriptional regulator [Litorivicinus lipolyticus]|uniref:LysR family transcriptional regulator n=1 Tax=Litorivicinus lipolyticus TaxID=418701 RepID=A0A5Q2QC37_9GAMM|nr:LysR family transcriptional regulator [Litorivicinus lipolyticus]QGG79576.1 LysR family transcriptional regulator [Litorivicinus lipolyticus]
MHRIDDEQVFCEVVEHGSFSDAGRALRVSTAVISARIARLEERLGLRLLNRTTRSVVTTEAGQVYYHACREVVARMRAALDQLEEMQNAPQGVIKVTAPDVLGREVIAPLLAEFRLLYPSVDIRLHIADRVVNIIDESLDLAIRHGYPEASSWVLRPLALDRWVTCGSPDYLAGQGTPDSVADLTEHNCLLLRFHGSRQFQWQYQHGADRLYEKVGGSMDASASGVLASWAKAGLGLVQQSVWNLHGDLSSGALVPVLEGFEPKGLRINALMPDREHRPAKIGLLLDFLAERMAQHPSQTYLPS